jgi:hypothetical protein
MTLIAFYRRMAAEIGPDSRLVLNHLMRALTERGWLPAVEEVITGLAERGESAAAAQTAIADLVYRRLVDVSADGARITGLLGAISLARTPHRGHLDNSVDVFVRGGLDLLSLNAILVRGVDGTTACGRCEAQVSFRMEEEAVVAVSPHGAAGFQATWNGSDDLADVSRNSPLFCSNTCLSTWIDEHPEVDGLPMAADLLLHIGGMMAVESGNARFALFGIEG